MKPPSDNYSNPVETKINDFIRNQYIVFNLISLTVSLFWQYFQIIPIRRNLIVLLSKSISSLPIWFLLLPRKIVYRLLRTRGKPILYCAPGMYSIISTNPRRNFFPLQQTRHPWWELRARHFSSSSDRYVFLYS